MIQDVLPKRSYFLKHFLCVGEQAHGADWAFSVGRAGTDCEIEARGLWIRWPTFCLLSSAVCCSAPLCSSLFNRNSHGTSQVMRCSFKASVSQSSCPFFCMHFVTVGPRLALVYRNRLTFHVLIDAVSAEQVIAWLKYSH